MHNHRNIVHDYVGFTSGKPLNDNKMASYTL